MYQSENYKFFENLFSKKSNSIGAGREKTLRQIGHKEYELTDHLGNVRLTFSDYREAYTTGYSYPRLKVLSRNNYFPFGMLMPDRFANEEDAKPRFKVTERAKRVEV